MFRSISSHKAIVVFVCVYFCLQLIGLDRTPLIWLDEVTLNDPARVLSQTGQLKSSVFADIPEFQSNYYWQPPVQALLQSAVYSVFGFGIWQTRVPGVLYSSLCILVMYLLGTMMKFNTRASLLGAALFAFDTFFVYTSRNARMDSLCLLLLSLAFYLVLLSLRHNAPNVSRLLVLAGLATGAACLTHPVAVAFSSALCVVVLIKKRASLREAFAYLSALLTCAFLWVVWIHSSDGWRAFDLQFLRHGADHVVSSGLVQKVIEEIQRYGSNYAAAPLIPVLFLMTVLLVLVTIAKSWRKVEYQTVLKRLSDNVWIQERWPLLLCFTFSFSFNTALMIKSVGFYSLYPSLCLYLMMAALFSDHTHTSIGRWVKLASFIILFYAFATSLGARWFILTRQWQERDPKLLQAAMQRYIPKGSKIYAEPALWYAALENDCQVSVEDYFTTQSYKVRQHHSYGDFEYFVLEQRHQYPPDADSTSYCGSIVVNAPSAHSFEGYDTLYKFDVLRSIHFRSQGH